MKNKLLFPILALLCLFAQGAWADDATAFGGGDGAAKTPYIISSAEHWNQLATDVAAGTGYSGKYFRLDADITVSEMLGTGTTANDAKPFQGTFDGNGHTLTFNHTSTADEGDIAPFRFITGATIKNLHVDGTIVTANSHTGGLAGRTYGTTLIQNCRVSTVIRSSVSGDGTHGGIVALKPNWSSAKLTIDGCVFDGKILTTNGTTLCSGFVGYTSVGALTIKNSLYAPAAPAEGETPVTSSATFYRTSANNPGTITLTNAYYTQPLGTEQGKQAYSVGFPDGFDVDIVPTGTATEYNVSGITAYDGQSCLKLNRAVYAAADQQLAVQFVHDFIGFTLSYSIDGSDIEPDDNGVYTITVPNENVTIGVSMSSIPVSNIPGSGTEADPYQIANAAVWDYIVGQVNAGTQNYATAYYQLTNDIAVTTMMGTDGNRFKGHFDGNGKTLTVDYNTSEAYTAPFRYVDGATISNLHVDGTITTSAKFAGGLIAHSMGTSTIENCRVSVRMTSTINGDGSHGGIVGFNTGGTLSVIGTVFDGYMLGGNTNNCGGFVGWNESSDSPAGSVGINHCLFMPKGTAMGIDRTFARSRDYNNITFGIGGSYCTTDYGDNQQARIYRITADDNVSIAYNATATYSYSVSGVTFYDKGLKFDGVLYAQNGNAMPLSLTHTGTAAEGYKFKDFATTNGTLAAPTTEGGTYTLTMTKADATIYATYEVIIQQWSGEGSGTEESPYIISSSAEWDEFVSYVNVGMGNYPTAYYKLDADISVTTMVGTDGYQFLGLFDGNGHKLTLSYGTAEAPFSEDYCAPFRYINSAEIHNLTVDGNIFTAKQFAAGIAGHADVANTISNCRVSATINSSLNGDGTHGGFVANIQSGTTTIIGSAFNGRLLGTDTNNCGGFVGWVESYNTASLFLRNCLFAPAEVTIGNDGSATFSRGRYDNQANIKITDCYYTLTLGDTQGDLGYASAPADFPSQKNTIAGVDYYVKSQLISNVAVSDITSNSASIGWEGTQGVTYQVSYRRSSTATAIYFNDFENDGETGWTVTDADGDGYNWQHFANSLEERAHSGNGYYCSDSYDIKPLTPDNWLISPQLKLDGTLKVWLKAAASQYPNEHFAIYLSTTGNATSDFTVTLVPETVASAGWVEYSADLSSYNGQPGYIAIRHFNCADQWALLVDDFGLYPAVEESWSEVSVEDDANAVTLSNLKPNTAYEYQVVYQYGDNEYRTPIATFTTINDMVQPFNLAVNAVTSNTATVSWEGYAKAYNLRYRKNEGEAQVTLSVPEAIWGRDLGYQMLLDDNHDTYDRVISNFVSLTESGDVPDATYAEFEYKIPENADGKLTTQNVVKASKSVTITIPAGIYDWCITNPSPEDEVVWLASIHGEIRGRADDYTFEAGKHYTFKIVQSDYGDEIKLTVEDIEDAQTPTAEEWTTIEGIASADEGALQSPTYTLTGLEAKKRYMVEVQAARDDEQSTWGSTLFTTADATSIGLADNADNSSVIEANKNQVRNVTLVGRTLYRNGSWNTLCLPFSVTVDKSSVLAGGTAMTFDTTKGSFSDNTLTLNFNNAQTIPAGTPFIIKWEGDGTSNITEPVFEGVTISTEKHDATLQDVVTFTSTYAPVSISSEGDDTKLYLGAASTLYYPNGAMTIGSQRAYFQLAEGITAGEKANGIRAFVLNFGSGEQTGLSATRSDVNTADALWYSLDGRRLNGRPTQGGVYLNNGRKVVIR